MAGAADAVRAAGIACFGPSAQAARIEGSKAFAKDVMAAAGVPTARAALCETAEQVDAALAEFGPPYVVKDDGLAAGKGVVVTDDLAVARAHAAACGRVLVEEYLDGPEVSLFWSPTARPCCRCCRPRTTSGSATATPGRTPAGWAPTPRWTGCRRELVEQVVAEVAQPTVDELRRRGTPFSGLLYVGLAMTSQARRWSSSTPGSATRRPRWCWRCWTPRRPACSMPRRPGRWPAIPRRVGAPVPPSPWWSRPPVIPAPRGWTTRSAAATTGGAPRRHPARRRRGAALGRRPGAVGRRDRRRPRRGTRSAYGLVAGIAFAGGQYRTDIAAGARPEFSADA